MLANIGKAEQLTVTTILSDNAGYDSGLLGQHGLSLFVEVVSGGVCKRILLDTGQNAEPVLHNMDLLGIDPKDIDMIVLSHCHYDHTGGLLGILKQIEKEVPVIAHPTIFRDNFMVKPYLRNLGISRENSQENIIKNGGKLILTKEPLQLMNGVIVTGEVERTTDFEEQGIGSFNLENGELISDMIMDDTSIVIDVKDQGLFIASGCSHAGIINIIKHAVKITGTTKVYGVMGGLHLIDSPDEKVLSNERVESTAKSFAEMNLELVVAGHCTGLKALNKVEKHVGEKFLHLYSGRQVKVGVQA